MHYGVKRWIRPFWRSFAKAWGTEANVSGTNEFGKEEVQRAHGYRQGVRHGQGLAQVQCGWSRVWQQKQVLWKPGLSPIQRGDTACFDPLLNLVYKARKRQESEQGGCTLFSANDTVQETHPHHLPSSSSSLLFLYDLQVFKMELELDRHREGPTNRTRNAYIWRIKLP